MKDLTVSRRAVTCALLAAPAALIVHPAPGAPATLKKSSQAEWDAAQAHWQAAFNAVEHCPSSDDEIIDPLADAEGAAMMALMVIPAPDLNAFATKVRLYLTHEVGSWFRPDGSQATAALQADADRFAKGA